MASPYPIRELELTAAACRAFARATDDDAARYGSGDFAPPMASVLASVPLGGRVVLADPAIVGDSARRARLLHVGEDIRWLRPLRVGDRLRVQPRLVAREPAPSGELLVVAAELRDAEDEIVVASTSRVLFRVRRPRGLLKEATQPDVGHGIDFSVRWTVADDQSSRYADAADDHNPIHIDDDAARAAGFAGGRVLHGMCTMAFAQRAVIDEVLDGDPSRLRRLRVRFTKPVYMGDELTLSGWRLDDGGIGFEVHNQRGRPVILDGLAEIE